MREQFFKSVDVVRRPFYLVFGLAVSAASFTVYALLLNRSLILTYLSEGNLSLVASLVPELLAGFARSSTLVSLTLTLFTSLLIGLNFTLAAFRLGDATQLDRADAGSIPGILVSVVAPACPACATTFLAFTGVTSIYALLPFHGASFQLLSVLLLVASAHYTASRIDNDRCRISPGS